MTYVSTSNVRRIKHHELIVRRSGDAYKAVVLAEDKIRLEGAEATSVKAALQALFDTTAEILEGRHDVLEEVYDGERMVERDGGSRIAKEATPPPDATVTDIEDGLAERAEATVMGKRKQGRPKKVYTTKPVIVKGTQPNRGPGRPRNSVVPEAADGVAQTPAKRGPGRPRKAAAPEVVGDVAKGTPKRGRGRPTKNLLSQQSFMRTTMLKVQMLSLGGSLGDLLKRESNRPGWRSCKTSGHERVVQDMGT